MLKARREADVERYHRKVEIEKRKSAAPAMPVGPRVQEPHREKLGRMYFDKLCEVAELQCALVARVVSQKEINSNVDAQRALDKEWQKLVDKQCWLSDRVREYSDVASKAQKKGVKALFEKNRSF